MAKVDNTYDSILKSLQLQEQEIRVINNNCLFILSHVCQSLGDRDESLKCLYDIEQHIDIQMKKDKEIIESTFENLKTSSFQSSQNMFHNSNIALEGKSVDTHLVHSCS